MVSLHPVTAGRVSYNISTTVSVDQLLEQLGSLRHPLLIDGSIWWWPYLYPCNDKLNVRRRDWPVDTSKSGFTMAVASCLLVNNVFGVSVDVPARRVSLRPFCPWPEFSWEGAKIGSSRFDVAYQKEEKRISARIVNRNSQDYTATIQLMLGHGQALGSATVNGKPSQAVLSTRRFGRPAASLEIAAPSLASVELVLNIP